MAGGNPWEMSYTENSRVLGDSDFSDLDTTTGYRFRKIVSPENQAVTVNWKLGENTERKFEDCHFALPVENSSVANCKFIRCRFHGSSWKSVKFSQCTFDHCHFSGVDFTHCNFLNTCKFLEVSASAEGLRMEDTAINPSAFLKAMKTNVASYNNKLQRAYQKHRLIGTKEKVAKIIFDSTRNVGNVDYYYDAYKRLSICWARQQIEQYRYIQDGSPETAKKDWLYFLWVIPACVEMFVVVTSGFLTNWGRSLLRPLAVFVFTYVYLPESVEVVDVAGKKVQSNQLAGRVNFALVKATEISLVAGYTAHVNEDVRGWARAGVLINLMLGIGWYSLVFPVLSRRTLR